MKKHPYFGTKSWEVDYSAPGIFGQAASEEKRAGADRFVSPVEISPHIVRDFKAACRNAADRERQRIESIRKAGKRGGKDSGSNSLPNGKGPASAENSASSSIDFADFSYVKFDQLAIMNMADMAAQDPKADASASPSSVLGRKLPGTMSGLPEMEAVG